MTSDIESVQPLHRGDHGNGRFETIIVGAGIAGLACARQLHDAGHTFLVVSENIGGRIRRSRDGSLNFGAYYARADYHHVNRFLDLGRRVDRLTFQRHEGNDAYSYSDRRFLLHLPQAFRFAVAVHRFRRRYRTFQERTVRIGQAAALRADPVLMQLYGQTARDYVVEHRLDDLAAWYLTPGIRALGFVSLDEMSAFSLLLGSVTIFVPMYEFTPRLDGLVDGFRDSITTDTVVDLDRGPEGHRITTASGATLVADHVVVATPLNVARRLLHLPEAKKAVSVNMFQISGTLRTRYAQADVNLFAEPDPTLALARQENGDVLVVSKRPDPDFGQYFDQWHIEEHAHWDPAFHFGAGVIVDEQQGPGLYVVGDHNVVCLEDAYLTGLHAAGQVLSRTGARR